MGYAPKRGPWKRKNGPCVECGSESCRTVQSFACWIRCFQRATREHSYVRCGEQTRYLREAEITMFLIPQLSGAEAYVGPAWAVAIIKSFQEERARCNRRFPIKHVAGLLSTSPHNLPPPPAFLSRIEELRAFAVLRGWEFKHGMWYR